MKFEPISEHKCKLGESPFWSSRSGQLLYVDVHNGAICRWTPGREPDVRQVSDRVTFVLETADSGLAVGLWHGIGRLAAFDAETGPGLEPAIPVEADRPTTSVNDGRCDPRGRLWFGTLEREKRAPVCGLYSWTAMAGLKRHVSGVSVSNGLQWSPKGDLLYYVDSWKQRVDVWDYDLGTGEIANGRTLAEIPKDDGMPDGINVDSEGRIYVALYGGGCQFLHHLPGHYQHNRPNPKYWALSMFISVDPDPSRAHARLARMENMFNWYKGAATWASDDIRVNIPADEEAAERTVTGSPDDVVDQLLIHASDHPYTEILLTWLAPGSDRAENLQHFEMLCEQVVVPLGRKMGLPDDRIELRV